jgi:hypothetical protein
MPEVSMRLRLSTTALPLVALVVACSASNSKNGPDNGLDGGTDSSIGDGHIEDSSGFNIDVLPEVDGAPTCATNDCDKDGYKPSDGDCNDLDATINPEAFDFADDKIDNDCNGFVDDPVVNCASDGTSTDATEAVRAMDMCKQKTRTKSGAVFDALSKAEWFSSKASGITTTIVPDNEHQIAVGILPSFGANAPRNGTALFGLSSGPILAKDPRGSAWMDGGAEKIADACATIPLNADDCKQLTNGTSPAPGVPTPIADYTELKLTIQVPSNAQAMTFDFSFYSTEFNEYWHTAYNDAFFAIAKTSAFDTNVAKDDKGNAITVNSGFFQLCPLPPGPAGIISPEALVNCVGDDGDKSKLIFGTLAGTKFDGSGIGSTDDTVKDPTSGKTYIYGGGSGWLTTKFGVTPGEVITLRLMIMDTSDGYLDSAAVIDNMSWEKAPPKTATGDTGRPPA